jgi:hypothetical protein
MSVATGSMHPHEAAILSALEEAAREVVESSAAHIEIMEREGPRPLILRLVPHRDEAAALTIQVDDERQLTYLFGRDCLPREEWSKRLNDLLDWVREAAEAVIAGGYSEEVRLSRYGRLVEGKATLARQGHDPERFSYLSLDGRGGPWQSPTPRTLQ